MISFNSQCSRRDFPSLYGLRAIAFLAMVFYHSGFGTLGTWAVAVFFSLSGFLIMNSHINKATELSTSWKDIISFAWNKIKKLYLLHLIILLPIFTISIILYMINNDIEGSMSALIEFFFSFTLLQAWIPNRDINYAYNGVAWFLSAIAFFYFCFPVIRKLLLKITRIRTCVLFIIFVFLLQLCISVFSLATTEDFARWITYIFPVSRLLDCVSGALFYLLFKMINDKYPSRIFRYLISILFVFTIAVTIVANYCYKHKIGLFDSAAFKYTIMFSPLACLLIFLCSFDIPIISFLKINLLKSIAKKSGYMFLIHQIILKVIWRLEEYFHFSVPFYVSAVLCVFLSFIFSFLYEKIEPYFARVITNKGFMLK